MSEKNFVIDSPYHPRVHGRPAILIGTPYRTRRHCRGVAGCCWSCVQFGLQERAACRSRQIFASLYCIYVLCHVMCYRFHPGWRRRTAETGGRVRYIEPAAASTKRKNGRTNNWRYVYLLAVCGSFNVQQWMLHKSNIVSTSLCSVMCYSISASQPPFPALSKCENGSMALGSFCADILSNNDPSR